MSELVFDCTGCDPDLYSTAPTIIFRLRLAETTGAVVHAVLLRIQIRIEPLKRHYTDAEAERLDDLFGGRARWGDTMKPLQFANAVQMVTAFEGSCDVDVPVPLTYDYEVSSAKYFNAIEDGEIPFIMLFSGTTFLRGESEFTVEQIPWHKETNYRLPVSVWKQAMDVHYPDMGWIRLERPTLDALSKYKTSLAAPTWELAFESLLKEAGVDGPGPEEAL